MRILLIGPQGSGKGTQAQLLSKKLGMQTLSTGEILRKAYSNKTKVGIQAHEYWGKGILVPDDVITMLLKEELPDDFILDGYPRNLNQAKILDEIARPDMAILITIPDNITLERLSGRLQCRKCGNIHGTKALIPKVEGKCDKCGGELYTREDDKPEAIKKRLDIYHKETEPMVDYYRKKGIVKEVNGDGPVEEVFQAISKLFKH